MTASATEDRFRLFIDPAADGAANMATDDCLLAEAAAGGPPTLRLYRWAPATLSLGYFQRYDDPARLTGDLAALPVVRRITGGGAIVHADELTYSLAMPIDHILAGRHPSELYMWMHDRIAEAIASLGGRTTLKGGDEPLTGRGGPLLCFACHARFDLMVGPDKLVGSAQRRTRSALLQHGSVVLRRTHPVQPSASLADLLGRDVDFDTLADALIDAIAGVGIGIERLGPTWVDQTQWQAYRRRQSDPRWLRRR